VIKIERDSTKTDGGVRLIPLNRDAFLAMAELLQRCELLGVTDADHYIFPACENGKIDATRPMKTWRSAWRTLTKAAGLRGLRFHDLRHLAITELLESGLPDQAVMEIAGYVSGDPVTGNFPRLDFNAVPERKLERFRALMAQTTSQKLWEEISLRVRF
jgi:integrase